MSPITSRVSSLEIWRPPCQARQLPEMTVACLMLARLPGRRSGPGSPRSSAGFSPADEGPGSLPAPLCDRALHTKISLADRGVLCERLRGSVQADSTRLDDKGVLRDFKGGHHVLLDKQDGHARSVNLNQRLA